MGVSRPRIHSASLLLAISVMIGCGSTAPIRPNLPPSETDLILLKSTALCERKPEFLKKHTPATHTSEAWGSGQEIMISPAKRASQGEELDRFRMAGYTPEDNIVNAQRR